jgi:hypothetical protein
MKVLSTILGIAVASQLSLLPVSAQVVTTQGGQIIDAQGQVLNSTGTPVLPGQVMTQPAVMAAPGCGAVVAQPACAPTVIQQPAVVERAALCGTNPAALVGAALVGAGIATAIALPIALHHRHHSGANRNAAAIQQQQLLFFAEQQRLASAGVGASFVPGFGFGSFVPGIGFVPAAGVAF